MHLGRSCRAPASRRRSGAGRALESCTKREFVSRARRSLGLTQRGLGGVLGVSAKAVQSYEQGWRPVPVGTLVHLLLLLRDRDERDGVKRPPCWTVNRCSRDVRATCSTARLGTGRYCWAQAGGRCRVLGGRDAETGFRVHDCLVVSLLCRHLG
jgi:DNA-binding XRE family transcriptional regulator